MTCFSTCLETFISLYLLENVKQPHIKWHWTCISKMLLCKMPALFCSVWSGQKRACWIAQSLLIEWLPGSVEAPGVYSVCRLAEQKHHCTWRRLCTTITLSWMRPDYNVSQASNPSLRSNAWPQSHNTSSAHNC